LGKGRLTKRPGHLPAHVPKTMISAPSAPQTMPSPSSPSKASPLIPGGPRAPSTRMVRSRTLMPQTTSFKQSPDIIDRKQKSNNPEDAYEEDLILIKRSESTSDIDTPPRRLQRNRTSYQPISAQYPPNNPKPPAPIPQSLPSGTPVLKDEEFEEQLTRLGDLLPHVGKDLLAVYLRRAGQDVKAVGMYIADEQAGRVR
jgi:hypothetical protein